MRIVLPFLLSCVCTWAIDLQRLKDDVKQGLSWQATVPPRTDHKAKYVRVSFCGSEQARLVNEAALDVSDCLTVAMGRLEKFLHVAANLPKHPENRKDGRVETIMETYQTFIDPSFWAPDEENPELEMTFSRKLELLNHVVGVIREMQLSTLKSTPQLEITCGYAFLSKYGPGINWRKFPDWYFDRRHSVGLPENDIRRWKFAPAMGPLQRDLDDGTQTTIQTTAPMRSFVRWHSLPPLDDVVLLSNYMWRDWSSAVSLHALRATSHPSRDLSIQQVIAPNLAAALLSAFATSVRITGPRKGIFLPESDPFDPSSLNRLRDAKEESKTMSAEELDGVRPWLHRNRAGFVYMVIALYLNHSDWSDGFPKPVNPFRVEPSS